MTIKEVSKKYNITPDTLRYYEKIGLITNVPRTSSGIRDYDQTSCQRIEFIKCMRDAGVQIEALLKYFELFDQGKTTVSQRKQLLEDQRRKLKEKQTKINTTLKNLETKINIYKEIEEGKRKDFTE